MKLKEGFVLCDAGDEHMAVATGDAMEILNGMIRSNDTADFILHLLMEDTTEEKIVEAMKERYDAPQEVLSRDVSRLIAQIRAEGFLDE